MSVTRRGLTVVLLVFLLLANIAVIQAQGEGVTATVARFLYVRALPDVEARDFGRLEPETEITLLGRTANSQWLQLRTADGIVGWGRANAITFEGDIADLPVVNVARQNAAAIFAQNLRVAPDLLADVVGQVEQGTLVTLVAKAYNFVYVTTADGLAGWANPNNLQFTRERGASLPTMPDLPEVNAVARGYASARVVPAIDAHSYAQLDPGTPVNVIGRNEIGNFFQIQTLDGLQAWAAASFIWYPGAVADLPVTEPGADSGVVTRFAVLRAAPDNTSAEVGRLSAGTVVQLLLASGDRLYVKAPDGTEGWALASALSFTGGAVPEVLASNATVTADAAVNLRAGPSLDAPRNGAAQVGERLAVVGVSADGQWYRVIPSTRVAAWVFADLVTLDEGVGPLPVIE